MDHQLLQENIERFYGGSGHSHPLYYYIPYLFFGGLPWSLLLSFVVWDLFKKRSSLGEDILFLTALGAGHVRVLFCLDGQASGVSPATLSRSVDVSGSLVLSLQSAICANFRLSLGCDTRRGSGCSAADHQFGRLVEP